MENQYDLAIHLAGEQAIPNLLGIRNIPAKRHLLLTSEKTDYTFDRLTSCEPEKVIDKKQLDDPFDLPEIGQVVSDYVANISGPVAVNLTGGTKPMSMGTWAWLASRSDPTVFYYFDTQGERQLQWETGQSVETSTIAKTLKIDDFIRLSNFNIQENGVDMALVKNRRDVTLKIWKNNYAFQKIQTYAQSRLGQKYESAKNPKKVSGHDKRKNGTVEAEFQNEKLCSLAFNGANISMPDIIDLKYLAGGWFEEFVYWTLEPLLDAGKLTEMRLNTIVKLSRDPKKAAQEFDLLATDGLRLLILECKAGNIEQKNLDKLQNVTQDFAGVQGLGVLVARWKQNTNWNVTTVERAEKSSKYAMLHGDNLKNLLPKKLLSLKPGDIEPPIRE